VPDQSPPATTLDAVLGRTRGLVVRTVTGDRGAPVSSVTVDSRDVRPGSLFCCIRGEHHDGHAFAADAARAGAAALVVDHLLDDVSIAQVLVDDTRIATALVAAAFHEHPADRLDVVGVTGTNGKTTTVSLLAGILGELGRAVSTIGTLTGAFTTPEAPELQQTLAGFAAGGVDSVAMEVSSHALALHRVDGMTFAAAVFTNLGRDHLDLHGTLEEYFGAKARLFEAGRARLAVVNTGDEWGRRVKALAGTTVIEFDPTALRDVEVRPSCHRYTWNGLDVRVPLGARFNVANSLAALTTAVALGCDPVAAVGALSRAAPVPGRFEAIAAGQPFAVIVDFAHTPDGLDAVLDAAADAARGHRVIVVFGCGGDRDRAKRPLMGAAAARRADLAVITSDNPRTEDPDAIIADVVAGVPTSERGRLLVEPDRRAAMAVAFRAAHPGDVVVIAGKGHEQTQTVGTRATPFDDRVVARAVLESLA
jgi:UDP-N-acetylmuramoyl-L-alanyl-D-glutamate--2,6-diaminopimelate ligase